MMLALILFTFTAFGGATLLALRVSGKPLPMALALLHGALAITGLAVLAFHVFGGHASGALAVSALVLLSLAGLGGAAAFSFHLRQQTVPMPLALVHATIAISGVACLLLHVIRQ